MKRRLENQSDHDETSLPKTDVPHLYKDEAVDLETGEVNPPNSGKSDDADAVFQNGNVASNDGPRISSPKVESTSEDAPVKGSS